MYCTGGIRCDVYSALLRSFNTCHPFVLRADVLHGRHPL
jgi:predicted sulfurtransferase